MNLASGAQVKQPVSVWLGSFSKISSSASLGQMITFSCWFLCLFVLVGQIVAACEPTLELAVVPTARKSWHEQLEKMQSLHKDGVQAIPTLIRQITDTRLTRVPLGNPYLSNRKPKASNFCGLVAAYFIELILSQTEISIDMDSAAESILERRRLHSYIYPYGIILCGPNNTNATSRHLTAIKAHYSRWWAANSDKTIEELRAMHLNGESPLRQSSCRWN